METVWYIIIAGMLATFVVLDGFDLGVGILHNFVARNDEERRTTIASIGPVWDGNEVWLIASGGVLFFSFPRAYAAGFSGFYMPLMMVLWLLILRGLSIEFRSKESNALWRSFWDGTFAFSSVLLSIVLGAALGNVIRGVPLDASGYFSGPLFTDFRMGPNPGVLDWYTVLIGIFTLFILTGHGALYLAWKTTGAVRQRSQACARPIWTAVVVVGLAATAATNVVRPDLYREIAARPIAWPLVLLAVVGLAEVFINLKRDRELSAFLGSACFIASLLAATAAGLYPNLLISTLDSNYSLTAANASTSPMGLRVGLVWWTGALVLAIVYFTYLFHSFRGKVDLHEEGYGH